MKTKQLSYLHAGCSPQWLQKLLDKPNTNEIYLLHRTNLSDSTFNVHYNISDNWNWNLQSPQCTTSFSNIQFTKQDKW